jgi:drug/metabolite transporter (DMT)-like permease
MRPLYLAVLVGSGLAWGSTQTLGKISVSTGMPFLGMIFWQLVIGAVLLGAIVTAMGKPLPLTVPALRFAAIVAVLGTLIPNSTFLISVSHLPAGIMSILISTVPLLSFPIALMIGMDRFSPGRLAGLALGLAGVALIAAPQASLPDAAMAAFIPLALIGPLFYAMESNFVAWNGTVGMNGLQAMALTSAVGAVICLPIVLATGQWINPIRPFGAAEWAMVAGSVVHAFAYSAYVWLASRAGAVFAAQSSYIVTGTGVIWAMVLLNESYSGWVWAALALMMLGLTLVQPRDAQPAPQKVD